MGLINAFLKWKRSEGVSVCRVSDLLKKGHSPQIIMRDFIHINRSVWGDITNEDYIWTEEMLESQFRICPEHLYCAFENGEMVATASGFLSNEEDMKKYKSWLEKTGNGTFYHHIQGGNIGFGADLSVMRGVSGKISERLMEALLVCGVLGYGLKALYLGSRIPRYHKNKEMKVGDYVFDKTHSGKPLDPELYFYLKDRFEIVEIIPDYMKDPESLNYGVLIRWRNPFYTAYRLLPFLKPLTRMAGRLLFLRIPSSLSTDY
ncbi:MAG: hypothetical protein M1461_12975 [Nitrospirae bacterium]|nr:hypothetical protein [Nitrospirota bacterium]